MKSEKMPWLAVRYSMIKGSPLKNFAGPGIPCLVVLDSSGSVVADSYVDGKYVGPSSVLTTISRELGSSQAKDRESDR